MSNRPLVSVLMSVYNGERFLHQAVESILAQSFDDFEFIIINDGSTDNSAVILDSFKSRDGRVLVYHQGNRGLVDSLNLGAELAKGKYIARMDADDIAVRQRIAWQVEFMEKHPEVAVLGGAVEWIDQTGKSLGFKYNPVDDSEIKSALLKMCPLYHPSILIRRDVLISVGAYRKDFVDAEDYDLFLRIADCHELANLSQVVLKYRMHPDKVSVRKLRQQCLSVLAARAAACARRRGKPEALDCSYALTSAFLVHSGAPSEAEQQAALTRQYLYWIRILSGWGEHSAALELAGEMFGHSDWKGGETWAIADVRLEMAKLFWKRGRIWRSILSLLHAVSTRPVIILRPVKTLVYRLESWAGLRVRQ